MRQINYLTCITLGRSTMLYSCTRWTSLSHVTTFLGLLEFIHFAVDPKQSRRTDCSWSSALKDLQNWIFFWICFSRRLLQHVFYFLDCSYTKLEPYICEDLGFWSSGLKKLWREVETTGREGGEKVLRGKKSKVIPLRIWRTSLFIVLEFFKKAPIFT